MTNDLISKHYLTLLRTMHTRNEDWGSDGAKHAEEILELLFEYCHDSVLDYGCGKGVLRNWIANNTDWHCYVNEYDPGIPGKDKPPIGTFDLVVCCDVMEHVERAKVSAVIAHIAGYTAKHAFFVINTQPARATLPDGRNAHITVKPPEWWMSVMSAHQLLPMRFRTTHKELICLCRKLTVEQNPPVG